jgi:hypothetical protein
MISADTSSVVALLKGEQGRDVEVVRNVLIDGTLVLAPASVAELLSDPESRLPSKSEFSKSPSWKSRLDTGCASGDCAPGSCATASALSSLAH